MLATDASQVEIPPLLRTPVQFKKLTFSHPEATNLFRIQGTVTFVQPTWLGFFCQQGEEGIYIASTNTVVLPVQGARIEVVGRIAYGVRPYLILSSWRPLEANQPLPAPDYATATVATVQRGEYDASAVVFRGDIERVDTEWDQYVLTLSSAGQELEVRTYQAELPELRTLLHARVEVRGVVGPILNERQQFKWWCIWAYNRESIKVLQPGSEVIRQLPLMTVHELQRSNPDAIPSQAKVRGRITYVAGGTYWIQNQNAALAVSAEDIPHPPKLDQWTEWLGYPKEQRGRIALKTATLLQTQPADHGALEIPNLDLPQIESNEFTDRVVRLSGAEFLYGTLQDGVHRMTFHFKGEVLEAELVFSADIPASALPRLHAGERVEMVGVLTHKTWSDTQETIPVVHLRSPTDLRVLTPAPWPIERTLRVVSILSLGLLAVLAMVIWGYRNLKLAKQNLEDAEESLISLNNDLEHRIENRTRELESSNRRLNAEIEERKQMQQALADREARLRDAQAIGRLGSFYWDAASNTVTWSDELFNIYGRCKSDFQPSFQAYTQQIHPLDQARVLETISKTMAEKGTFKHDYRIVRPDGEVRWVLANARVRCTPDGSLVGLDGTCQDITELRQAEARVVTAEAYFRSAIEHSSEGLLMSDSSGLITYASPGCEKILGYTPARLVGIDLGRTMIADFQRRYKMHRQKVRNRPGAVSNMDALLRHGDGRRLWIEISDINRLEDPEVHAVVTHLRDITERKELEASLRDLSARVLRLQDEERSRLARDLHDGPGQNLAQISKQLMSLVEKAKVDTANHETTEVLSDCHALCSSTMQELRTLSYLLHPPILDVMGLTGALKDYAEGFSKRSGIQVSTADVENIGRLPPDRESALLRVAQEALTNIHRHSGSQTATLLLRRVNHSTMLEISDDGVGIPSELLHGLSESTGRLGVGLAGMKERMRQLGGNLIVESSSQGTRLCVVIPSDIAT